MRMIGKKAAAALIFLLVLGLFLGAAKMEYDRAVLQEKRVSDDYLNAITARIEQTLASRILNAQGLVVYIQSKPDLTFEDFTRFAEQLVPLNDPIFRNMAGIRDTTIVFEYPLKGNEAAMGLDLAQNPAQRETILRVKETGKMRLTAPVNLVQGGRGIIARMPVLLVDPVTREKTYWGQISLVFDYDKTIASTGLNDLAALYDSRIVERDQETGTEKVIWQTTDTLPKDAITRTIKLAEVDWEIDLIPKNGWRGFTPTITLLTLMGIIFSSVSALYLMNLMSTREELESKVTERTRQLEDTNEWLEQTMAEVEEKQAELTLMNEKLEDSIQDLQDTQRQLIISEKLAALGELVAGVAHEINTPLGICVTLSSFLHKMHQELDRKFSANQLNRTDLSEYLDNSGEALELLVSNLERSSTLVTSFKQVAVDQATLDHRRFKVRDYLQDVLNNLQPKFKNTGHTVELLCDPELELVSYPGALSQILTNLVMNSLVHGFDGIPAGRITIEASRQGSRFLLLYQDDGIGIPEENLSRVFNPFFTTRKSQGSTGLGLHIIHTIVTQTLKGRISLQSKVGQGVRIQIDFDETPILEYA